MMMRNGIQPCLTGIAGLDAILMGGLTPGCLYLVEGTPGAGKTTLGLQFILEGRRRGESTLYVALSETQNELAGVAHAHGWSLEGVTIHEMSPSEAMLEQDRQLTIFHSSELELSETIRGVLDAVEELRPTRVVFDSLSELRLLAQDALQYRRQILALKKFFAGQNTTVLMIDDMTGAAEDQHLHSVAHGIITLMHLDTDYGTSRRQMRVLKMRGVDFFAGLHDYVIRRGGLQIFPRLVASHQPAPRELDDISSGNRELDALLGSGIPRGSSTLFMGPAGSGKSTTALLFCVEAARRRERSIIFMFDETIGTLERRAQGLGMPLDQFKQDGLIDMIKINAAEMSPGEFAALVRGAVLGEDGDRPPARLIMIDSLNGYLNSMSQEKQLLSQLHEMFTFLNHHNVVTLVSVSQIGTAGDGVRSPIDTTYLADNVILFRFFESFGKVRRAVSVIKKRGGAHETTIRELIMKSSGLHLGAPLSEFQGVLSGVPEFHGDRTQLLEYKGTQ